MSIPIASGLQHIEPKCKTLTRMDKVVIEDFYHMTTMDGNANWMKLTHLLPKFSLNLRAPFCTFTLTSNFLIAFLNVRTREKKNFPLCIICMLMPQSITILTLALVCTLCSKSTPRVLSVTCTLKGLN